jgi:hypothetical protein
MPPPAWTPSRRDAARMEPPTSTRRLGWGSQEFYPAVGVRVWVAGPAGPSRAQPGPAGPVGRCRTGPVPDPAGAGPGPAGPSRAAQIVGRPHGVPGWWLVRRAEAEHAALSSSVTAAAAAITPSQQATDEWVHFDRLSARSFAAGEEQQQQQQQGAAAAPQPKRKPKPKQPKAKKTTAPAVGPSTFANPQQLEFVDIGANLTDRMCALGMLLSPLPPAFLVSPPIVRSTVQLTRGTSPATARQVPGGVQRQAQAPARSRDGDSVSEQHSTAPASIIHYLHVPPTNTHALVALARQPPPTRGVMCGGWVGSGCHGAMATA